MKYITKLRLAAVHQLCDAEDKSTEYTLQLMQDACGVELDTCVSYMGLDPIEHSKLFKEVNQLVNMIINLETTVKKWEN